MFVQVYLFQRVAYSWPNSTLPLFLVDSLSHSMVVQTQKLEEGWQLSEEIMDQGVYLVITGLSEENDCQAKLDWHRVASGNNRGKWESSSMRLLADGVLEVTRKRLLHHLLHPGPQEATSTATYRPFSGHLEFGLI